jgi:hypothetical protein
MNEAIAESAQSLAAAQFSAGEQFHEIVTISTTRICVGDVALELNASEADSISVNHALAAFSGGSLSSNIRLDVRWKSDFESRQNPDFNSLALWTLFHEDADFVFDFTSPLLSPHPYKRLRVSGDFCVGEILLNSKVLKPYRPICPLEYPADELLITNYLAHHGFGVEVHGCGLVDQKTGGHLFLGHSGAGKSTTARLWQLCRHAEILSDDRIILRLQDGELWMYGTPWHGEAALASPRKAKLNRIFVLQQGVENRIVPLSNARAVGELFARCFPPFHSVTGLDRTIEFLNRMVETVPCYEFSFIPEVSAIQTVLGFHD